MAQTNAALEAQIKALTQRFDKLAAQYKADQAKLQPLLDAGAAQSRFLASLGQMGFLGQLSEDPFDGAGPDWQTGERSYVNEPIDKWNRFQTEAINQNYMKPS